MSEHDAIAQAAADGDEAALAAYLDFVRKIFEREGSLGPHLGQHLGIDVVEIERDRVVMRMGYRSELVRVGGIVHGGAIMSLADHAAGCLYTCDPRVYLDRTTGVTTDFHTSFLRSAPAGEGLLAEAVVLRRGRTATFMEVNVRGDAGTKVVASIRTTYVAVPMAKIGMSYPR